MRYSPSLHAGFRAWCADDDGARSPGRFFAANELKAMLAFMVVNYDLPLMNERDAHGHASRADSRPDIETYIHRIGECAVCCVGWDRN